MHDPDHKRQTCNSCSCDICIVFRVAFVELPQRFRWRTDEQWVAAGYRQPDGRCMTETERWTALSELTDSPPALTGLACSQSTRTETNWQRLRPCSIHENGISQKRNVPEFRVCWAVRRLMSRPKDNRMANDEEMLRNVTSLRARLKRTMTDQTETLCYRLLKSDWDKCESKLCQSPSGGPTKMPCHTYMRHTQGIGEGQGHVIRPSYENIARISCEMRFEGQLGCRIW